MSSARWVQELRRQLRRGKHVVLHGNVFDLSVLNGEFLPFDVVLNAALSEAGYTLRARYDSSTGVTFAERPMRERFVRLEADPQLQGPPPQGGYNAPGRNAPAPPAAAPTAPGSGGAAYHLDPADAFPALSQALTRSQTESISAVIHFSDRLFGTNDSPSPAERDLMVVLARAAQDAHRHMAGPMAGMRNAIVLVASRLAQVPAWLYHDNPLFQLVAVDRPGTDTRRQYLEQAYTGFYGATSGQAPRPDVAEDFVALTDGLSTWDLEAVRLASHDDQIPIAQCRRLLDFFKHGTHEDPWEKVSIDVIDGARDTLRSRVIGQDRAIEAVLNVLVTARGGVNLEGANRRSVRPKGVLFFVGPTGVGKTELAKALTELIFRDSGAFARYDMSEYQMEHAAERLTGAPPGFVGYEQGGQLTNRMKAQPFSLVLFDEIEKAHPRLMDKFLQVLDDGRLTDGMGETVYFSQSLILFTSNIGSTRREQTAGGAERILPAIEPGMSYDELNQHYRSAVRDHFLRIGRPEILGRVGEENIVAFDMLRPVAIPPIVDKFLAGVAASARERYGATLVFDPSITRLAQDECSRPENLVLGGRAIRNFVSHRILPVVNQAMLRGGGGDYRVIADGGDVRVTRA